MFTARNARNFSNEINAETNNSFMQPVLAAIMAGKYSATLAIKIEDKAKYYSLLESFGYSVVSIRCMNNIQTCEIFW